jgi:hypothetical protein
MDGAHLAAAEDATFARVLPIDSKVFAHVEGPGSGISRARRYSLVSGGSTNALIYLWILPRTVLSHPFGMGYELNLTRSQKQG